MGKEIGLGGGKGNGKLELVTAGKTVNKRGAWGERVWKLGLRSNGV